MRSGWMRVILFSAVAGVFLLAAASGFLREVPATSGKYAIILQAGKAGDGSARAVHAFLYATEMKSHGHQVVLIFDGAGTAWIEEMTNPESESMLKPYYEQFRKTGITQIICDYCAGAFQVKDPLVDRGLALQGEYQGHPSIAKWVNQGYQLIVL